MKPTQTKNRLAGETSTYLLQHAGNPVDWYPWGEEALRRARSEDKPILLSIGYAACHWCHVMEHESFENPETAKIMNEHFVCIKVDREERTDLDDIYMKAVQLMTGHGGWPMTVFLTPELKPFFGGTYFPSQDRHGLPSFERVLIGVNEAWKTKRKEIEESAQDITKHLVTMDDLVSLTERSKQDTEIKQKELILAAAQKMLASFDNRFGGFGSAPKFPHSFSLDLGMRCQSHLTDEKPSLKESFSEMVEKTLDCMAYGGINDQIGGGFARYSVDRQWLVPHFEKMLYDNALLSSLYFDGYSLTGREYWKQVGEGVLHFVSRELSSSHGGFYSSLDADSEGVEGKYYLFTLGEIEQILGSDAAFFCQIYGASKQGNFEHESNILHLSDSPEALAGKHKMTVEALWQKLTPLKEKVLAARQKRVPPGRDEKVLTSWNSLMASSFIKGYEITGNDKYLKTAKATVNFILKEMVIKERLMRTWGQGKAKLNGYLDDYTYFTQTLLDLAGADGDSLWLTKAIFFAEATLKHFSDGQGGLFYTSDDHESLLARPRSHFDSSVPSGTSVALFNMLRLGRITGHPHYAEKAEALLAIYQPLFSKLPDQFANMICALDFSLSPWPDIVVTLPAGSASGNPLLLEVHRHYLPNKVVTVKNCQANTREGGAVKEAQEPLLIKGKGLVAGKPAVFLCENFTCEEPVSKLEELRRRLKRQAAP
ncbi:MAG: thioredoxin domain-containing protein [Candidatus Melainabacteria bacterium]|nr:MAG: thioredoxin domain-containing protein [Candidatus Melainabacteria bacterium]